MLYVHLRLDTVLINFLRQCIFLPVCAKSPGDDNLIKMYIVKYVIEYIDKYYHETFLESQLYQ